ncbi:MAG: hypothetical protein EA411_03590 [Saprospirales bacterium]|nr:MAG: hypothetical protein EA411_03590 [Saprospirales bacterium]
MSLSACIVLTFALKQIELKDVYHWFIQGRKIIGLRQCVKDDLMKMLPGKFKRPVHGYLLVSFGSYIICCISSSFSEFRKSYPHFFSKIFLSKTSIQNKPSKFVVMPLFGYLALFSNNSANVFQRLSEFEFVEFFLQQSKRWVEDTSANNSSITHRTLEYNILQINNNLNIRFSFTK